MAGDPQCAWVRGDEAAVIVIDGGIGCGCTCSFIQFPPADRGTINRSSRNVRISKEPIACHYTQVPVINDAIVGEVACNGSGDALCDETPDITGDSITSVDFIYPPVVLGRVLQCTGVKVRVGSINLKLTGIGARICSEIDIVGDCVYTGGLTKVDIDVHIAHSIWRCRIGGLRCSARFGETEC